MHVDDSLQITKGMSVLNELKLCLSSTFEMKDLSEVHWFLGLEIMCDHPHRTIMLSQERYTLDILGHFNMLDSHPISTPMATGIKLEHLDAPSNPKIQQTYQQMLGCLMYTMTCTHPDLAYAVGALSRHSTAPSPNHLTAIRHVFRYLSGTRNAVLIYDGSLTNQKLVGYTDSDWAGDPIDCQSIAGHTFLIGNVLSAGLARNNNPSCYPQQKANIWLRL